MSNQNPSLEFLSVGEVLSYQQVKRTHFILLSGQTIIKGISSKLLFQQQVCVPYIILDNIGLKKKKCHLTHRTAANLFQRSTSLQISIPFFPLTGAMVPHLGYVFLCSQLRAMGSALCFHHSKSVFHNNRKEHL